MLQVPAGTACVRGVFPSTGLSSPDHRAAAAPGTFPAPEPKPLVSNRWQVEVEMVIRGDPNPPTPSAKEGVKNKKLAAVFAAHELLGWAEGRNRKLAALGIDASSMRMHAFTDDAAQGAGGGCAFRVADPPKRPASGPNDDSDAADAAKDDAAPVQSVTISIQCPARGTQGEVDKTRSVWLAGTTPCLVPPLISFLSALFSRSFSLFSLCLPSTNTK